MEDHSCLLLDNWHTPDGRMVSPSLMELWGRWRGEKIRHYRQLYINHPEPIAFMPVAVDTSVVFMTILVAYCFWTLTVKPQLWLMRYQRNQINLDFFGQLVMLILRDQWGWFWLRYRSFGSLHRLICHLGLLYLYLVSFVLDVLHHS